MGLETAGRSPAVEEGAEDCRRDSGRDEAAEPEEGFVGVLSILAGYPVESPSFQFVAEAGERVRPLSVVDGDAHVFLESATDRVPFVCEGATCGVAW